jgi:5-methyltetrahydrofolate--homocysteine methyltransferase
MDKILDTIYESILDGEIKLIAGHVQTALDEQLAPVTILNDGMIAAMTEVGELFEEGEFFVPEMLVSARTMQAGLAILRPHLIDGGVESIGRMVIGTVKGDIHDIGKNLVTMMMEGGGFEVIDLGIDQSADDFVAAIKQHKPNVVGISALLTTTMPYMEVVVDAIRDNGLRDDVAILVGGAPINDAFAEKIGADMFCKSAGVAVNTARKLIGISG